MAKLVITSIGNKFIITDEAGSPVGDKLYNTERGAKQAISKAGHTYDKPEVPKVSKPKESSTTAINKDLQEDLDSSEVLRIRDEALAAAGFVKGMSKEEVQDCDWNAASKVAQAHGFKNYYALKAVAKKVRNGIWFKNQTPAKQEELRAKSAARQERKAVRKAQHTARQEMNEAQLKARNSMALLNGFKNYRTVKRASERGDVHAITVRALIDKAMANAVVKSGRELLETPFAKLG